MSKKINIAVIGAGYWGTKLVHEYLALSKKRRDLKLQAIADKSPESLCKIRENFSLPTSMLKKDYNEILEDSEITGVHIATPNETHYEIAMKAIAAGKNVLLEKPMCLNSSDAFRLARQAEKNGSVLLIGHIFRFNNAINKVKQMIENGEINGVRCLELRWVSDIPPPPGRDIIFDLAPHPVDILNHIFEEWPTELYAKGQSYERKKVGLEEVAFVTMEFPEDVIASLTLSWIHHGHRERTILIVNEKSAIMIEAVEQRIILFEKGVKKEIFVERNNTIESEINHFIDRIKNGVPPINSPLIGVRNVTVLEAMKKSLREDNVVSVV
ncbi:MAG: Gfo/Idh/MocA family oxidoreductase [Candidatus Bathyarchaeia archaeon]